MQYAAYTHIGCVREENQDKVLVAAYGKCTLAAVFDGMGGERAGEEASRIAEEEFISHFNKLYREKMDPHALRNLLISSVSAANSVIYTTARMNYRNFGMGTTCVAAFADEDGVSVVNVGDSRAYYYAEGELRQITKDHTVVNMLLEHGKISQSELATHPQRHMLTRAVGVEKTVRPDYFRIEHTSENYSVLLCSDGLSGCCGSAEIADVLEEQGISADEKAKRFIDMALNKGGRDNVSAALIMQP